MYQSDSLPDIATDRSRRRTGVYATCGDATHFATPLLAVKGGLRLVRLVFGPAPVQQFCAKKSTSPFIDL